MADPNPSWEAFAVAAPGLESIVAGELDRLGAPDVRAVAGGVEFRADRALLYRANLHLRVASRIIVRLAVFRATSFAELERRARSVPWERVLRRGAAVRLRVTCRKSRLYHSDGVAERLMRDLAARLSARAAAAEAEDDDGDGQLVVVRFDRDQCTISADASGRHLHQRGYRTAVTEAPMRETLAAALVLASGWDGRTPLLDPFCGSGTIPIEAAMLAGRVAPGRHRRFRFGEWPDFDARIWEQVCREAQESEVAVPPGLVRGSDRSAAAVRAARENAGRAAVEVAFDRLDVSGIAPAGATAGSIVTNPPYGVRLGDRAGRRQLVSLLGDVLRRRFQGWEVTLLVPEVATGRDAGLTLAEVLRTTNGGLAVHCLHGRVSSASTEVP